MVKNELPWVEAPCWQLSKHADYTKFFVTVCRLDLGPDAQIVLDVTSPSGQVEQSLRPYLASTRKPFLSSRMNKYVLPFDQASMDILASLINTHAAPEVCNEILVIRDDEVVLSWYDFPDDPFRVVGSVSEQSITTFATELGSTVEREE